MAINKVTGNILADNLQRRDNLSFNGNLLVIDVSNSTVSTGNITFNGDSISAVNKLQVGSNANIEITGGSTGQVLTTDGAGNLAWTSSSELSGLTGNAIRLGTPDDGNLVENAAYNGWTTTTTVTDGLDDLNQLALNIANNTYVGKVDFSGDTLAGASPVTVNFTGSLVGNATNYAWDFGDGNTSTSGLSVSHTYSNVSGGQFTVQLTAFNSDGTYAGNTSLGAVGSVDSEIKNSYITLYTPTPIPAFTIADSTIDSATSAEITNNSQYATSYNLDWGSGVGNIDPGDSFTTAQNTYTNSSGDTQYTITLYATSSTAGPSPVTQSTSDTIDVFSEHITTFTSNTTRVVNEQTTSGGVVEFENTTATSPGLTATFGAGQKYRWTWGDGNITNVNIQDGLAGNPGANILHTFALSSGDQAAGNTVSYNIQLETLNGHSNSPFPAGANITITVEPDVRADFTGTAVDVSDRTGDTAQNGYLFTDYRNGNNRAVFTFENSSQNGDEFDWNFGNGNTVANVLAGNTGTPSAANITNAYNSTGSYTVVLDVSGTPDTIAQTDQESKSNYITINANPTQPGALSSKTLNLTTTSQGTSPRLAAGATDNTAGNIVANGTVVTRYVTSTPVVTNTITDANTSVSGTLEAIVSGSEDGNVTFNSGISKAGTYTSLVIVNDGDAHDQISASTYPTGFAKVFDARISKALSDISVGYNDYKLSHSSAGDTNVVGFVKDDLTAVPTISTVGTLLEGTGGTKRYVSGIPYYNTGSPTVILSGTEIGNLVGQTYTDQSNIVEIDPGTNYEGTDASAIASENYTYANIDGAVSMLTSGIPNAETGVGSAYAIGNLTVDITSSSVRTVEAPQVRARNVNGVSNYSTINTKIQVHTAAQSGISEIAIPVSDDLGATYDDDGVRVADFLAVSTDTPAFNGATNYYTNSPYTENADPGVEGTQEATVRLGVLQHDVTDYSTGYLPVGPDRSGDTGTQYFTFAFRRSTVANFDINITSSSGITGMWIAAPGTAIDSASSLNGWLDATSQYAGAGVPGANTGSGGNGSNGCALTGADVVPTGSSLNGGYTLTLGSENMSNATGNVVLVRIALASGESVSAISVGVAS